MDCKESEQLMMAAVDGELDAPSLARLRAHLAKCAACSAAYAGLTGLRAALKGQATVHVAPAHLRHRIIAALPRKAAAPTPVRRGFGAWPWAWINFGAAAAFSVAFATTLALHLAAPSASDQ